MSRLEKIFLILLLLFLVAFGILISEFVQLSKERELEQSTINGLRIQNMMEKRAYLKALDSIQKDFAVRMDSVAASHLKSLEANKVTQIENKKLKEILFVAHNDSSRTAELKALYKSYPQ